MSAHKFPPDRRYTKVHSWLAFPPGDTLADFPLRVGITDIALAGADVSRIDMPPVRSTVDAGSPCAVVWSSGGTAIRVYAPISGLITMTNSTAAENPSVVANDPFHDGWLFAILPIPASSAHGLLALAQYADEVDRCSVRG